MKILLIEDQVVTVKAIIDFCLEQGWCPKICNFNNYMEQLNDFEPDVVILDWIDDAANEDDKGRDIFEQIWIKSFKPIIIFSAIAVNIVLDEKYKASNLIRRISKGDETPVIDYLKLIQPYIPVITGLKNEFNNALIQALNSIDMMNNTQPISLNVMRYVFAKRVSTYFDKECGDAVSPPWIQYIYPAISPTLCVGDLIRNIPPDNIICKAGNAEEYKIILTPSCDLTHNKVTHALCARCYNKVKYHGFSPDRTPSKIKIDKIISSLNTGYNDSFVSLPSIPEVIPYLTIDLKKIELLPLDNIALNEDFVTEQHTYCRIASIDSPFREQIVWAYMLNSCRPGMPNRDMNIWAKDLMLP